MGNFNINQPPTTIPAATQWCIQGIQQQQKRIAALQASGGGGSTSLTVGGVVVSGSANRVLFEGSTNLVAESANLTFDLSTLALTGVETITKNALTTTATNGLTIQNTTAATGGVTVQNSPFVEFKGTSFLSSASVITGMRVGFIPSDVSSNRGAYSFDFNDAGSYTTGVLSIGKAAVKTTATLTISVGDLVVNAGSIVAPAGGLQLNIVTKTTNYTVALTDFTILFDTTSGNLVATLPNPATNANQIFNIKKIVAANTLTLTPASGLIDGAASLTVTTNNQNTQVQSNGTNYYIL